MGPPAEHVAYRHLANVTGLPLEFLGYDAVDAVVLATSDPTRLASVTQDRWNALQTWVQHGENGGLHCQEFRILSGGGKTIVVRSGWLPRPNRNSADHWH